MWVCALLMLAILDVFAKFLQIGKWQKVTILLTCVRVVPTSKNLPWKKSDL